MCATTARHEMCATTARHEMCATTAGHEMCATIVSHEMCATTARREMCSLKAFSCYPNSVSKKIPKQVDSKKPYFNHQKKSCWGGKAPPGPPTLAGGASPPQTPPIGGAPAPPNLPGALGAAASRPPLGKKRDGRRPGTAVGPSDGRSTAVRQPSEDRPTIVRRLLAKYSVR